MLISRGILSGLAVISVLVLAPVAHAASCDELLKQTRADTDKTARAWNAFIEAFNKYAFVPSYSNVEQTPDQLRGRITEIRSLSANTSGFIAQAAQQNCRMDLFKPSQDALVDIDQQLMKAVLQLNN